MIRVRTPLRLPFAGGLTDIKAYAEKFGGVTVSATLQLGVEVRVEESSSGRFEVSDANGEEVAADLTGIRNELVREALRAVDPEHRPMRVEIRLEVVGKSGLGASGAIAVALLHALRAAAGQGVSAEELGREAARLEVEVLAGNSGYHDPHICARGGLLRLDYQGTEVEATPVPTPDNFLDRLEESLLLFATGVQASTRESLDLLSRRLDDAIEVLHQIKSLASETEAALRRGDLTGVANCIARQQRLKQRLPGTFRSELVSEVTSRLERLGATVQFPGGKVGAYMFICCPQGQQSEVREALADFSELPVRFSARGSLLLEGGAG